MPPRPAPIVDATDEHPQVQNMPVPDLVAALTGCSKVAVLDVRTTEEFAGGHIIGARHEPSERFLGDRNAGEALGKEIVSIFAASDVKTIVVYCQYSNCSGPLIANILASVTKAERSPLEVALLDGGFHKFLNSVRGKEGDAIGNVPGLIEGVKAKKWRRTSTRGLVDADAVDELEQLGFIDTPKGSSDGMQSSLKAHRGKLRLEDFDEICKRLASPRLALSRDELTLLFESAPQSEFGLVDWHDFVDFIYSGAENSAAPAVARGLSSKLQA